MEFAADALVNGASLTYRARGLKKAMLAVAAGAQIQNCTVTRESLQNRVCCFSRLHHCSGCLKEVSCFCKWHRVLLDSTSISNIQLFQGTGRRRLEKAQWRRQLLNFNARTVFKRDVLNQRAACQDAVDRGDCQSGVVGEIHLINRLKWEWVSSKEIKRRVWESWALHKLQPNRLFAISLVLPVVLVPQEPRSNIATQEREAKKLNSRGAVVKEVLLDNNSPDISREAAEGILSVDFHWKSVNDGVCCPDQRAVVTHSLECVKAASQFFFRVCRKVKIWVWSISRSATWCIL